jgi:DNA polymerase III subunit gamma/tau
MDKFVVSARKYRPQNFNTVVGQAHITTTLKNAILHNQLAHAFLFCGPRGVGKTTCARILAKTINCEHKTAQGEACNQCQSCTSFDAGTSLNIHELDAASNNSVDDIRSLVDQVRFPPQAGAFKVYIVDEVHMLSAAAFNAFLKTLEEPPPYAIFILATTEKHKILPTILSRCQIFDFKRITNADTVEHLQEIVTKENINAEKAALQLIAQKSEGCMRDSLSILDKIVSFTSGEVTYLNTIEHLNILDEDYYFKLLEALLQQDLATALILYDEINSKGFEGDTVLNGFAEFCRNIMVCKDAKAAHLLDVIEGMQDRYAKHAGSVNLSYLVSALNILSDAEIHFKQARNRRLHVELCLIKLCYLQQALELATDTTGEVIKKKRIDGPIAYRTKAIPTLTKNNKPPLAPAALVIEAASKPLPTASALPIATAIVAEPIQEMEVTEPKQQPTAIVAQPINNIATTNSNAAAQIMPTTATNTTGKKSLLASLQVKHHANTNDELAPNELPLNIEDVNTIWANYITKFKEKQQHTATTSFEMAQLKIVDDNTLEVISQTTLNQKFIELEKVALLTSFQKTFNNKKIQIQYTVAASEEVDIPLDNKFLTSAQRFEMLVAQYPLVQDLKDKLKLELGYS